MMVSELLTLRGATDNTNTTGVFSLTSDLIYGSVQYIQIPKGMKAKIWCKRISGAAVEVIIEYTHNILETPPTFTEVDREVLTSTGEISLEKRRPIVLRGITGLEGFRVSWNQSTPGLSYVELEVELTDDE